MNNACVILSEYRSGLDTARLSKLSAVCDLLAEESAHFNLTALKTDEDIALLHLYDSLSLLDTKLFADGKSVIDIGCGAGFPSLPLACFSNCIVTANDSTAKKLRFVQSAAETAGLKNIKTLFGRAEELGRGECRGAFDIAVSRGVARMNVLAEWCLPLVSVGGYFVAMKGTGGRAETEEALCGIKLLGGEVEQITDIAIPLVERTHTLVVIRKTTETPGIYPRQNSQIVKKPL